MSYVHNLGLYEAYITSFDKRQITHTDLHTCIYEYNFMQVHTLKYFAYGPVTQLLQILFVRFQFLHG